MRTAMKEPGSLCGLAWLFLLLATTPEAIRLMVPGNAEAPAVVLSKDCPWWYRPC